MKRRIHILCILLAATQVMMAGTKLNPDMSHFFSVWGQIGGSTLLNNSHSSIKPGIGVSPSMGIGYRLCYNDFLLQFGCEAQYAYWTNKLANSDMSLAMLDTEDMPFVMKAQMRGGKDWVHNVNVVVPLLLGYEHYKFYFLLGPELAYSVYATSTSKTLLTTTADYYGRYADDFAAMPNHLLYVDKQTSSGSRSLSLNYTVYAHAEIGLRLGEVDRYKGANIYRKDYRLYLSLFADYGVMNIHANTSNGASVGYKQTDEGIQFYVFPAMLSTEMNDSRVNPLTVGVKFTAAFQLPEEKNWMIYNGRGANNYRRVRGKSQAVQH